VSALFTINFRRDAYLKERARARRRVLLLGMWVAYFGVMGLVIGLYGLNCVSLTRRVHQTERQAARLRQAQGSHRERSIREAELTQVERYLANPRRWRDRLTRLAQILPPNVKLTSLAVNPQNLSGTSDQNRLIISGELRAAPNQDRMQSVMKIVSTLHDDSLFSASYKNIKLASTRVSEGPGGLAEFVVECR
jgi:Tfp pilus assembly protein PilN